MLYRPRPSCKVGQHAVTKAVLAHGVVAQPNFHKYTLNVQGGIYGL